MSEINKKILFIIAIIISLGVILTMVYFAFLKNRPGSVNNNGSKIQLETPNGSTLSVNDFIKGAQSIDDAAVTLKDIPDVAVFMYNKESKIFTILIHAQDQETYDKRVSIAEQSFLQQLGITEQYACGLRVEVSSDGPVNDLQDFSNIHPLSFCRK